MKRRTPWTFARHLAGYHLRGRLQHLIVHVTNHCNFRCRHCFVDFTPKRDLALEDYRGLARDAGRVFWLDVAGGEPFLRKDLPEIVGAFDARVVHVHTNGSLEERTVETARRMHDEAARRGAELGVSLSLDGLRETHDRLREAPGNWDAVWRTFERLRAIDGLSVYVNTVLTDRNEGEILALMEEVWRRRPDFHAVTLLRGRTLDDSLRLPPLERLRELGPGVFAVMDRYAAGGRPLLRRMARNYHRYVWNVSLRTLAEERQVVPCLAGTASLVVWGDGQVASCELLPAVGDLRRERWSDVLRGPALARQRASIRRKECHCTHNCALFDSIMYRPQSLPRLVRQPVRGAL